MKKVLLSIAVCLLFALSAAAQNGGGPTADPQNAAKPDTSAGDQTSTSSKKSKKSSGDAASEASSKSGKSHQLTGCVEKSDTGYALKKGSKSYNVTGSDDLSAHVGHKVTLSGDWAA